MIEKHGKKWRLRRRVPSRFHGIELRRMIKISLKTDSEAEAVKRAADLWQGLCDGWEAALAGESATAQQMHARAVADAQRLGLRYIPATDVAALPLPDLLNRVDAIATAAPGQRASVADAALGLIDVPRFMLSDVLETYIELTATDDTDKSPDQIRRSRNPKIKAMRELIESTGDKPMVDFTHDDALRQRQWLLARVKAGKISSGTAGKGQSIAMGILRRVNALKGLGLDLAFPGLSIDRGDAKQRASIPANWIRDKLLVTGALDGINEQAGAVVLIMVNTGARLSEIAGLQLRHIDIDGDTPLMHIRSDGRTLKNSHSARSIPLAGVSLLAARDALRRATSRCAGQSDWVFPRYAGKDALSAAVNKYFRENKLLPEGATIYGIRHGFEDRLIAAGVADRVRSDLFGHSLQRQRYGDGGGDAVRMKAVMSVAL